MIPNEKQKAICEIISRHTTYWTNSNDISSPTHQGDLYNELLERMGELNLTKDEINILYNKIITLHTIIKHYDYVNRTIKEID